MGTIEEKINDSKGCGGVMRTAPVGLAFLSDRAFPTNSGPIDALGINKDGEIYIIETKLYKNPDKRLVVAQVLDYGASLWQ
jgi:hypothetical protein